MTLLLTLRISGATCLCIITQATLADPLATQAPTSPRGQFGSRADKQVVWPQKAKGSEVTSRDSPQHGMSSLCPTQNGNLDPFLLGQEQELKVSLQVRSQNPRGRSGSRLAQGEGPGWGINGAGAGGGFLPGEWLSALEHSPSHPVRRIQSPLRARRRPGPSSIRCTHGSCMCTRSYSPEAPAGPGPVSTQLCWRLFCPPHSHSSMPSPHH